jgi:hypothetical protein
MIIFKIIFIIIGSILLFKAIQEEDMSYMIISYLFLIIGIGLSKI